MPAIKILLKVFSSVLHIILYCVGSLIVISCDNATSPSNSVPFQDYSIMLKQGTVAHVFLSDIWACTKNEFYICGDDGIVVKFDGDRQTIVETDTYARFASIWGFEKNDIYCVGSKGVIYHKNTFGWAQMNSGTEYDLYEVWGNSSESVFAVGEQGIILWYDGGSWRKLRSGTDKMLISIWGSDYDNVFIGGVDGIILHLDGRSVMTQNINDESFVSDIWGTGRDNVYATTGHQLYYYNGSHWQHILSSEERIEQLWGNSQGQLYGMDYKGCFYEFDGTKWNLFFESLPKKPLFAFTGHESGQFIAAGRDGNILFFDGDQWEHETEYYEYGYSSIWGAAPNSVYFSNWEGLFHYDGNIMTSVDTGIDMFIKYIWGLAENRMYFIVNDNASVDHIIHYNGTSWEDKYSTDKHLFTLHGVAENCIYAVGSDHTLLKYDGDAWSSIDMGITEDLICVWAYSESDVFVVGSEGIILHFDGSDWTNMTFDTSLRLTGVWGLSPNHVYVAGYTSEFVHLSEAGVILKYDGTRWYRELEGIAPSGIWGNSDSNIFVVGGRGSILQHNGCAWRKLDRVTTEFHRYPCGFPNGEMYTAGSRGMITHFRPK